MRCIDKVEDALSTIPKGEAGHRLHGIKALNPILASDGCIGAVAASILGASAKPVRAILFDKSAETNWSLAWHQDRTICVKERHETPGFGAWTIKEGLHHVAPPLDLLTRMVTLRAHLDEVPATNAPLLIARGSHAFGRVPVKNVVRTVELCGTVECLAEAGDIWLYATLILHASEKASIPASRRVLQVDYTAEELPGGLEWLGV
nr:phytanoyl-CoA dioxygenase family protein [Parerythrobacter lacustris]